jgi:uncharacterized protein with HEPN domain
MIDAAQNVVAWSGDVSCEDFLADAKLRSAVAMQLIVIGEGARLLPLGLTNRAPDLPWAEVVGMRHRLAHGYARASAIIIRDTAVNWVPQLLPEFRRLLESIGPEES